MSIFSRFKKDKPKNSLSTTKSFFWGMSNSGSHVNERTALETSAVYSCVRVISEAIACLPLHVHKYEGEGSVIARDHELYDLLHTEPNPEMSSFVFRQTLMSHLLLYGNAYAQIIRDAGGRIKALYPLFPDKIDESRAENGELYYTYWRNADEKRKGEKTGGITLHKDEVLHIPGLSFDGLVGYAPIALAKNPIGLAIAAEEYGASFFSNNASPGGLLEHPGILNNHDAIRATWEALYSGSTKHHGIAVLEEGMKFTPVTVPPDQAQFLETRKFQLSEIARIFRIPPHMIGDLEKSSFNNIEQMSLDFVKNTLEPWVVLWEQEMVRALLTPSERKQYFIKFNMDGLLRGDYETRMKGYSTGFQSGYYSINDIRKLENLNPIENGDVHFINGNMLPLHLAVTGAYVKQQGASPPEEETEEPTQSSKRSKR